MSEPARATTAAKFGMLFLDNYEAFADALTPTELRVLSVCFKALQLGNIVSASQKSIASALGHKSSSHVSEAFKNLRKKQILIQSEKFPGFVFLNPNLLACGDLGLFLARNAEEAGAGFRINSKQKPEIFADAFPLTDAPCPVAITRADTAPELREQNRKQVAARIRERAAQQAQELQEKARALEERAEREAAEYEAAADAQNEHMQANEYDEDEELAAALSPQ